MIIVTGFEPFKNFKNNPSKSIAKWLGEMEGVEAEIVPVTYDGAIEKAERIISKNPEAVISFGLADGRPQISIERVAVNFMESSSADNSGYRANGEKIFEDGKSAYTSTLPINEIIKNMHNENIPAYVSYTAGTYVCNTLFYALLHYAYKMETNIPIGFVHLPATETMALKRRVPYVEYETMKKAAKIVVETTSRPFSP